MSYEVVKGIEFQGGDYGDKYGLGKLEIGDAILVPKEEHSRINSYAAQYGLRKDMKFSIRKYASDKYPDGYACIRVS